MHNYRFQTIQMEHVSALSQLFLKRQFLEREVFPFLHNERLQKEHIDSIFMNLFLQNRILGVCVYQGDTMIGYLFAQVMESSKGWMAWVPYEGLAIQEDKSLELIRLLYARASELWVDASCLIHSALLPLGNSVYLEAFVRLSFAIEHVHGVLDMNDFQPYSNTNSIIIRKAHREDQLVLGSLSGVVARYQNNSPVYLAISEEQLAKRKQAFESLVEEEDVIVFVAEQHQAIVGFTILEPSTPNLMTPDHSMELVLSGVVPETRNQGVGKALLNQSVVECQKRHLRYLISDWKITNLVASQFWPKSGFQPIAYRLTRRIDSEYKKFDE